MIKLFVLDIDGCITHPFVTPEWDVIRDIRDLQTQSQDMEHIPELSICTGRPLPYAEAVAQWLGIRKPIIFESGGGLFDPGIYNIEWSERVDDQALEQLNELRIWVAEEVMHDFKGVTLEVGKRLDVGIVSMDTDKVLRFFEMVKPYVEQHYPDLVVHRTDISVNIIVEASDKGSGLLRLADYTGIPLKNMAYIGDSSGDIAALEIAGKAFAPDNATEEVKALDGVQNLDGSATDAVLEGYRMLVQSNKEMVDA